MSFLKKILQYFFGGVLLIFTLPMLFEGGKGIVGALFMLIGGLICFPPTRKVIENRYGFVLNKKVKYLLVIWSFLSIGIFSKPTQNVSTAQVEVKPTQVETKTVQSTAPEQVATVVTFQQALETQEKTPNALPVADTSKKKETVVQKERIVYQSQPQSLSANYAVSSTKTVKKKNHSSNRGAAGRGGYILGPRGGCYYWAANSKVYVDHSFCR